MKSGNLVRLRHVTKTRLFVDLLVEIRGTNIFSFANLLNPYKRLCLSQNGSVVFKDSVSDKSTMFYRDVLKDQSNDCTLKCCHNQYYLVLDDNGHLAALPPAHCTDNEIILSVVMSMEVINENPFNISLNNNSTYDLDNKYTNTLTTSNSPLRSWEIERFINEGYLHLPQLVSSVKIKECCKVLNYSLGKPGVIIPGGTQKDMGKFEGGITNHTCIRELLTPAVHSVLDFLLGRIAAVDMSNLHTQVAFRFPELNGSAYIDESDWHTDGYRQDKLHPFSLLVGVCLSDVEDDYCGNLVVWPGSHTLIHQCKVGTLGEIDTTKLSSLIGSNLHNSNNSNSTNDGDNDIEPIKHTSTETVVNRSSLPSTVVDAVVGDDHPTNMIINQLSTIAHPLPPPEESIIKLNVKTIKTPLPQLPDHYQLKTKAGDVVLLHPDTAHTGGVNLSDDIRQMIYFRIRHTPVSLLVLQLPAVMDYSINGNSNLLSSATANLDQQADGSNTNSESNKSNANTNSNINKFISTYEELGILHKQNMWIDLPGIMNSKAYQQSQLVSTGQQA